MVIMRVHKKIMAWVLSLAAFLMIAVPACRRHDEEEFETFEALRGDIVQTVTASASVKTPEMKNYAVQTAGEVLFALQKGDSFKKGDVLFEVDNTRMELAVRQAEENLSLAQSALAQARTSYQQGLDSNHITVQMAQLNNELAQVNAEAAWRSLQDAQRLADASNRYAATTVDTARISVENAQVAIEDSDEALSDAEKRLRDAEKELAEAKKTLPADDLRVLALEAALNAAESALDAAQAQTRNLESSYKAAEAQYKTAQAAYEQAKAQAAAQVHSAEGATDQITISQSMTYWSTLGETQFAANQIRLAREGINQAQAQIHLAEIALEMAGLDLDKNVIRAPFDGMVYAAPFSRGETAAPGIQVLSIVPDDFILSANIDETDIAKLSVGQEVDFTLDAYFGKTFQGTLTHISPIADSLAGIVSFPIEITPEGAEGLLYGLSANLTIYTDQAKDVILAPPEAVYRQDGKEYVDLLIDGETVQREVVTGVFSFDYIEIISGVEAGDRIIIERI